MLYGRAKAQLHLILLPLVEGYSLSEKDVGVIGFVRKCEFVLYSKQILDAGCWMKDAAKGYFSFASLVHKTIQLSVNPERMNGYKQKKGVMINGITP